MKFELNEKEKEKLQKIIEGLSIVYENIDELDKVYQFNTKGIGNTCKVIFTGYVHNGCGREEIFKIEKDITDYDSW